MNFEKIDVRALPKSPVEMLADDWALLSAGTAEKANTMTVSWGAIGEIWGKDAAFVFVRPQRYTHEFLDANELFTLSFLGAGHKEVHSLCGGKSGRDLDKITAAGLTLCMLDGAPGFAQAQHVLVCRKMAVQKIDPAGFLDAAIAENYPTQDYHTVFIGEIAAAYANKFV